jgi:hypothetical protein
MPSLLVPREAISSSSTPWPRRCTRAVRTSTPGWSPCNRYLTPASRRGSWRSSSNCRATLRPGTSRRGRHRRMSPSRCSRRRSWGGRRGTLPVRTGLRPPNPAHHRSTPRHLPGSSSHRPTPLRHRSKVRCDLPPCRCRRRRPERAGRKDRSLRAGVPRYRRGPSFACGDQSARPPLASMVRDEPSWCPDAATLAREGDEQVVAASIAPAAREAVEVARGQRERPSAPRRSPQYTGGGREWRRRRRCAGAYTLSCRRW